MWPFKRKAPEVQKPKVSVETIWEEAKVNPEEAVYRILVRDNMGGGLLKHVQLTMRLINELEAMKGQVNSKKQRRGGKKK